MYRLSANLLLMAMMVLTCFPGLAQRNLDEALVKAIEEKDRMKVLALVSSGAPVDGSGSVSPLFSAVRSGDAQIVEILLTRGAKADPRLTEMFNATPLMFAAGANREDIVKQLLEAGADINARDNNGDPAINWAAYYGFTDMVKYLVKHGANMKLVGHGNALEIAMRRGHQDLVLALAQEMKVSGPISPEMKALIQAIRANDGQAVSNALTKGASANGLDETGRPVLHLAARLGNLNPTQLLLDAGAEIDVKDAIGFSALMEACRDGQFETVNLLLERGADVNCHAKDNGLGLTPLHMAAIGGHVNLLQTLTTKGANLNTQGVIGGTPMLWGFFESKVASVLALIDLGADPYLANRDGISPKTAAEQYEVKPVMDKLSQLHSKMKP